MTLPLGLLNVGPFELLLLAGAAVLLFGGDLPEMARKAAALVTRLRAMTSDLTRELTPPPEGRRPHAEAERFGLGALAKTLEDAARLPSPRDPPAAQTPPAPLPAVPAEAAAPDEPPLRS